MFDNRYDFVAIELGSRFIKVGFSGNDSPKVVFPTIVGIPKVPGIMVGSDQRAYYIGDRADEKRGILNLTNPIVNGVIQDWENLERILSHIFLEELKIPSDNITLLLIDTPSNSKSDRETLAKLLFDVFNIQALHIMTSAKASQLAREANLSVDTNDHTNHNIWVAGVLNSCTHPFDPYSESRYWVTREEFEDNSPEIIHQKFS